MCEPLYYSQPPVLEFTASVTGCQPCKELWEVTLTQTAFYPQGGGQPADRGTLNGLPVLDVYHKEGQVVHLLEAPLEPGLEVQGLVDGDYRLEMCQQHTGEHILSGLLHQMFGVQNLGFHIGQDYLTMDTSIPLTAQQLAQAEERANQMIWQDVPVQAQWYQPHQLASQTYRSKKALEGPVRLVTVPQADCCACCGTHVQRTGQVGLIKIIQWQNYKCGVRLFVVCGVRAYREVCSQQEQAVAIRRMLSVTPQQLAQGVERQQQELEAARFRAGQLEQQLFQVLSQQVQPGQAPVLIQPDLAPQSLQRLCAALTQRTQGLCAVFSPLPQGGALYALACADAQADLRPLCRELNQAFEGRGGGKPGFVQGSIQQDAAKAAAYLQTIISNT